jgi:hypothetical protein
MLNCRVPWPHGYRIWPMMVSGKALDHPDRFRFRRMEMSGLAVLRMGTSKNAISDRALCRGRLIFRSACFSNGFSRTASAACFLAKGHFGRCFPFQAAAARCSSSHLKRFML